MWIGFKGGGLTVLRLVVGAKTFVAVVGGRENIARRGCISLANENFKTCAGPGEVFAHSSGRVRLDHRRNTSVFERTLSQVRLQAAAV
jgi:hypothetical protein